MKGWENNIIFAQRIQLNPINMKQVLDFEDNPYLTQKKRISYLQYSIPFKECISLDMLLESLQSEYTMISKDNIQTILDKVCKHLRCLHQYSLSHGNLQSKYIFIKLSMLSDKLTLYEQTIQVEKIFFIGYQLFNQYEIKNYQQNDIDNLYYIIDDILKVIYYRSELLNLKKCQNIDEIIVLIDNIYQNYCKINNNKTEKEYEIESEKKKNEEIILKICKLIQINKIHSKIDLKEIYDKNNPDIEDVRLFNKLNDQEKILLKSIKSTAQKYQMQLFWKVYYQEIKKQHFDPIEISKNFEKKFNEQHQKVVNIIDKLNQTLKGCKDILQQIQNVYDEDFKFELKEEQDEQLVEQLFYESLEIFQYGYNIYNEHEIIIQQIKEDVKKQLQIIYQIRFEIELFKLILSLI